MYSNTIKDAEAVSRMLFIKILFSTSLLSKSQILGNRQLSSCRFFFLGVFKDRSMWYNGFMEVFL